MIVGAGIAGTACAHTLTQHGYRVTLVDKSRGVSGRITTKRWLDGVGIDMGAPYIDTRDIPSSFQSTMATWRTEGIIQPWRMTRRTPSGTHSILTDVGTPKMSRLARHLSAGIDLITEQRIVAITRRESSWRVDSDTQTWHPIDRIIITIPAPQIALIDGIPADILTVSQSIPFDPVATLLLETTHPLWTDPVDEDVVGDGVIDRIIADYRKPERHPHRYTYAIHACPNWTAAQYDRMTAASIGDTLLQHTLSMYGQSNTTVRHHHPHVWRYATAKTAFPHPFMASTMAPHCYVGGDGYHHVGVMGSLLSGIALGQAQL